ncbi:MAG: hypothetical protein D6812_13215 [Deltaproteobacteria bacterium]|nr:MAG: hypothetical protein D6812_13215 [Deltaproteobacteria bacterium]
MPFSPDVRGFRPFPAIRRSGFFLPVSLSHPAGTVALYHSLENGVNPDFWVRGALASTSFLRFLPG